MTQLGDIVGGKYLLERVLGVGGMGTVFQASHRVLGKKVAIKLLRREFASQPTEVERFHREAQAVASLGHRGIVEVHDVGWTDDGLPYMVLELLRGETLAQHFRRKGTKLDPAYAIELGLEILSALIKVHSAGVVHRDLKPSNLFICQEEDGPKQLKILDFGISKINVESTNYELTQDGAIMGTPWYMSPEQARGESDVDHRADLWAVGAILYEALTGRPPFTGDNFRQICFNIISDLPLMPSRLRPDIPLPLERVVLSALAKNRAERYQSAELFMTDLRNAQEGLTGALAGELSSSAAIAEKTELLTFDDEETPTHEFVKTNPEDDSDPSLEAIPSFEPPRVVPKTVVLSGEEDTRTELSGLIEPSDTFAAAVTDEEMGKGLRLGLLALLVGGALFVVMALSVGAIAIWGIPRSQPGEPRPIPISEEPSIGEEAESEGEARSASVTAPTDPPTGPELRELAPSLPTEPADVPHQNAGVSVEPPEEPPLTQDEIESSLRDLTTEVRSCLARSSRRSTTLDVSLRISGDGTTELVDASPRPSAAELSCLRGLFADLPQRATGREPVDFTYRYREVRRTRPRQHENRPQEGSDLRNNPFGNY